MNGGAERTRVRLCINMGFAMPLARDGGTMLSGKPAVTFTCVFAKCSL